MKLTHRVPQSTYTYLVEGFLAVSHITLKNKVLGRYPGFLQGLLASPSPEVQLLARVVISMPGSNTRDNIDYIRDLTGFSPRYYPSTNIRAALPRLAVPEREQWRLGLLSVLFEQRGYQWENQLNQDQTNAMIDSLCNS